jgi:sulfur relay protein TusB/DsrH
MSSILFIMLKSPYEYSSLDHLAAIGGDERTGVILFEDAVYFAVDKNKGQELLDVADKVYVMRDDFAARGLASISGKFLLIDYPTAVDLIMEQYDQTITV